MSTAKGDKQHLPALVQKNDAQVASPQAEDRESTQVVAGQYWRVSTRIKTHQHDYRNGAELKNIEKGTVLLVEEVRYTEGKMHSVVIAPHPLWDYRDSLVFTIAEFRELFVFEPDGKRVRAEELHQLQNATADLQTEIQAGPPPEEVDPDFGKPLMIGPGQAAPTVYALAVDKPSRLRVQADTERQIKIADNTAAWIATRTTHLKGNAEKIARFHEETATAMVATVQGAKKFAERLQQGLTSLGLYTGEGVTVEQIADGEEAAPEEPLTLMQRRLFLDEEYIVNLAVGGADWKDLDGFGKELERNPEFLNRVLPFPRCVLLMRYRRSEKEYSRASDFSLSEYGTRGRAVMAAMENEEKNRPNRVTFLLVRNGGKVYKVFSSVSTDSAHRLFPTKDEENKPFHGYDGKRITFDDVEYYEAKEEAEAQDQFYRRLLILLWGLNDRLNLFGQFYNPARYPADGFLSLEFQNERFRFVYDDENALTEGRPPFQQWLKERNAYLTSGSRLFGLWHNLITPASAPSVVEWGDRDHHYKSWRYHPVERTGIAQVITEDGEPTILVDFEGETRGWPAKKRKFKAHVRLNKSNLFGYYGSDFGGMVLDAVRPEDIDFYVNSRVNRTRYLQYLELFMEARKAIAADDAITAPLRERVASELVEAGVVERAEDAADVLFDAVRLWRAAHRGALPPITKPGAKMVAPKEAEALDAIRQIAYVTLRPRKPLAEIAKLAADEGREPLRLTMNGEGDAVLYMSPTSEEIRNPALPHPWVVRRRIEFGKRKGLRFTSEPSWTYLLKFDATERTVHQWRAAAAYEIERKRIQNDYTREARMNALDFIDQHDTAFTQIFGEKGPSIGPAALERVTGGDYTWVSWLPKVVVPVGVAFHAEQLNLDPDKSIYSYHVLVLVHDAWGLLYRESDEAGRKKIVAEVKRLLRRESQPDIESHLQSAGLALGRIPVARFTEWDPSSLLVDGRRGVLDDVWSPERENRKDRTLREVLEKIDDPKAWNCVHALAPGAKERIIALFERLHPTAQVKKRASK